jgi:curved DNA-binding protein CbpA
MERLHTNPTNLYHVLGVSPSASFEEIKASYRNKLFAIHPDKTGQTDDQATEELTQVMRAWSILGDTNKRAIYDAHKEGIYVFLSCTTHTFQPSLFFQLHFL